MSPRKEFNGYAKEIDSGKVVMVWDVDYERGYIEIIDEYNYAERRSISMFKPATGKEFEKQELMRGLG